MWVNTEYFKTFHPLIISLQYHTAQMLTKTWPKLIYSFLLLFQIQCDVHDSHLFPTHFLHVVHLCQDRQGALGEPKYRGVHAETAGEYQVQTKGE